MNNFFILIETIQMLRVKCSLDYIIFLTVKMVIFKSKINSFIHPKIIGLKSLKTKPTRFAYNINFVKKINHYKILTTQ